LASKVARRYRPANPARHARPLHHGLV